MVPSFLAKRDHLLGPKFARQTLAMMMMIDCSSTFHFLLMEIYYTF